MKKLISVVLVTLLVLIASAISCSAASVDYINIDNMQDAFQTEFGTVTQKEIVKGKYGRAYEISVLLESGKGVIAHTDSTTYATILDGATVEVNQTNKKIVVRSDDGDALKTVLTDGKKYYALFNDGRVIEMKGMERLYDYNPGMSYEELEDTLSSQKADMISLWVILGIVPAGIIIWFTYGMIVCLVENRRERKNRYNSYYDDYYDHY